MSLLEEKAIINKLICRCYKMQLQTNNYKVSEPPPTVAQKQLYEKGINNKTGLGADSIHVNNIVAMPYAQLDKMLLSECIGK